MRLDITLLSINPELPVYRILKDVPGSKGHNHRFKGERTASNSALIPVRDRSDPTSLKIKVETSRTYKCKEKGCETQVYSCSTCGGYIPGKPLVEGYSDIGEAILAGSEGERLYCGRCGNHLGTEVWKMSVMCQKVEKMNLVDNVLQIKF